jgi:hypothetical protein
LVLNKSASNGFDPESNMLLSTAQLDEFKAEGAVAIPGLIPPDVLAGWQAQIRAACTDGVDFNDPDTWKPTGRYAPEGGWPEFSPCLYDVPSLQSIVEQIGGGGFSSSHPAGVPWTPQVPMTRVILPSDPDKEWTPPDNGHLDGYAASWGGGFMAIFVVLLWDVSSPTGGGTAYWPRSHLANHRYFLKHPEQFDGSYMFAEPVKSGGHLALLKGDPSVGEVECMTGRAGDAVLFHGLTTHIGSTNAPGTKQPRVAQFARYCHTKMREQAPVVMFPDKDGTPWSAAPDEQTDATGFLPPGHPGRELERYDVPENLWKYWAPAVNTELAE